MPCALPQQILRRRQSLPTPQRHTETTAVTAPSPEREADEIARRILELNARGTEFPAIAVALRDVESWLPLIKGTFDRFGIPARYYFATPVRKHPVAIFLDGLITCALNDWDFNSTLTALRAHPAWGHTAAFDRFDFHVRDKMPGHGAQELLAVCEPGPVRNHIADCLKIDKLCGDRLRPAARQQKVRTTGGHALPHPHHPRANGLCRRGIRPQRRRSPACLVGSAGNRR